MSSAASSGSCRFGSPARSVARGRSVAGTYPAHPNPAGARQCCAETAAWASGKSIACPVTVSRASWSTAGVEGSRKLDGGIRSRCEFVAAGGYDGRWRFSAGVLVFGVSTITDENNIRRERDHSFTITMVTSSRGAPMSGLTSGSMAPLMTFHRFGKPGNSCGALNSGPSSSLATVERRLSRPSKGLGG